MIGQDVRGQEASRREADRAWRSWQDWETVAYWMEMITPETARATQKAVERHSGAFL